jgi:hypothetical protein
MTKEEKEQEIEHAKDFLIDIIPHNTPNFREVLQETAESYVDSMYANARRKVLEVENTEFDYGHNVKHYSED